MKIQAVKETYEQPEDCCGRSNEDTQTFEIETMPEAYVVLITERWAMESDAGVDELANKIKAMLKVIQSTESTTINE